MGMLQEFKDFAIKGNMIDMAVGIIIGGAFGKIVSSLVKDVIMPPIGLLLGGVNFSDLFINLGEKKFETLAAAQEASAPTLNYGAFANSVIDFLIIAFCIFMIIKQLNRLKKEPAPLIRPPRIAASASWRSPSRPPAAGTAPRSCRLQVEARPCGARSRAPRPRFPAAEGFGLGWVSPPAQRLRSPSTSRPMSSRPKTSLRSKLALALAVTLLGLLLCEGLVRVRAMFLYGTPASAITEVLLEHDHELNMPVPIKGKSLVARRIRIDINSLGFRSDEIAREKPAGTIRIACLGGSTTFCAEASSNLATWPQRLGELLRERYPEQKIEVINAAIPGCSLAGSLENLRRRVLPLEPDIVIVYHAHNDMKLDTRELAIAQGLEADAEHHRGLLSVLGRYSLLADLLQKNLSIVYAQDAGPTAKLDGLPPDLCARFTGLLSELHDLLAEREVELVLSTFVAKIRPDQGREEQLANAGLSLFYMPWLSVDQLAQGLELYNRAILDFGRENGVPVLADTSIPPDSKHYVDGIHFTDAGCERMAQRFHAHIEALGLIERRADVRGH